jgi:hypothetical protein
MTALQAYLIILNTLLVISGLVIAFYFTRVYNILAKLGATNTPVPIRDIRPARKGPIEVSVKFYEVNNLREMWIEAGYAVLSSRKTGRDEITLVMTKKANANR